MKPPGGRSLRKIRLQKKRAKVYAENWQQSWREGFGESEWLSWPRWITWLRRERKRFDPLQHHPAYQEN